MEKQHKPEQFESKIYAEWEKNGFFTPKIDKKKKPYSILLPPPNSNDPLHMGHALYVVEDILCRWHRMKGEPTLFLPGTDHAGIETQYVFEKELVAKGKSRFDFDRETLYSMVNDFVEKNRGIVRKQLARLGFSLDWTREKYTLDPEILKTVFKTFKKLHDDNLVYREQRIVNYCTSCGTAFSNLEVNHVERKDFLYYINYGSVRIATTRPETIFADVAVAVNPKDPRHGSLVGKTAVIPILNKEIPVIGDELVEIEFGTGALKITPGHDQTDFEIGQKHDLEIISCVDVNGKMINVPEKYLGMAVEQARKAVVDDLEDAGKLIKVEPLDHSISICYRCQSVIEPLTMPQWFIKMKPLAKPAIKAVKKGDLKIIPKRFEKIYFQWMENIKDWNISRQIVWGPRMPIWYCLDCNPDILINFIPKSGEKVSSKFKDLGKYQFSEIEKGLQSLTAPKDSSYFLEAGKCKCGSNHVLQETDTFDTWFSSGQWPLTTLGYPDSKDFKYFYPTSVLDTMWDILFFWVARMTMFGLYLTGRVPFKVAHMHCRVVDEKGVKMSKSKGNVIDPMDVVQEYGADALRMALVLGTAPGSDINIGEDKLKAMRNFANKIWNASRFIFLMIEKQEKIDWDVELHEQDQKMLNDLDLLVKNINKDLDKYRFGQASEKIYQFFWHEFCDVCIEQSKNRIEQALPALIKTLVVLLKLLHPFMPFISETIYKTFKQKIGESDIFDSDYLIVSKWPE